MQEARAGLHERARGLERVLRVDGLVGEVALAQADGPPVADVHGRQEDHRPDEVRQQPKPVGPGLLRVELDAVHGRPGHGADELAPVGRHPEHVAPGPGAGRERVHVVEGRRVGEPGGQLGVGAPGDRVPADVRHLETVHVELLDRALEQADALPAAELGRALEQQLHPQADPEHGPARLDELAQQVVVAEPAHLLHGLREGADAGQHHAVRAADTLVVARDLGLGAHVLERLLGRAQVAHAVVEDRDARHRTPFVDGTPVSVGSSATASAQRPREGLEGGLDHVVGVGARLDPHVQRELRAVRDGAHELLGEVGLEARDLAGGQLALEGAERTAGDVDRAARPRLVHRHRRLPEALDARAVAERLVERLAEHDPGVLHRVVRAGLEVALRTDVEVEAAVSGDRVEQVVEEADAGRAPALAGAVEPERQLDAGLAGRAGDVGSASHEVIRSRRPSRLFPACGAPSTPRGRGSPRPVPVRRRRVPGGAGASPGNDTRAIRRRKVAARERALEARGPAGGQHVVGPGHVVAEGGAGTGADEHAAGRAHLAGERLRLLADELEVLRRDPLGQPEPRATRVRRPDHLELRVGHARALGREPLDCRDDGVEERPVVAISAPRRLSAPCSAWASRSSATSSGSAPSEARTISSLGPAMPSMPTWPTTWRLASCT